MNSRLLLLTALLMMGCGGALKPAAYDKLADATETKNNEARKQAETAFLSGGYTAVDQEPLRRFLTLPQSSNRRCLLLVQGSPGYLLNANEQPASGEEQLDVDVQEALSPQQHHVGKGRAVDVCAFIAKLNPSLDLRFDDISRHFVQHPGGQLARSKDGKLVRYSLVPEVRQRRSVLIEQTCDHMPRLEPSAFERLTVINALIGADPANETITLRYDSEAIDVRCTDNTY